MSMRLESMAEAAKSISGPALLCDIESFENNARALLKASRVPLRAATKSIRVQSLLARLTKGLGFQGLLTFSPDESAWLASVGFDDLLVAYPTVDSDAIRKVVGQIAEGKTIRLTVDSLDHLELINTISEEQGVTTEVIVDVDASFPVSLLGKELLWFGVRRSPLHSVSDVLDYCGAAARFRYVKIVGLQFYEAQIAGVPDASSDPKSLLIRRLKKQSIDELRDRRASIVMRLRQLGLDLKIVTGGGTGSIDTTEAEQVMTEVTLGSGLFHSTLFDAYQNRITEPSLFIALEVCRQPTSNIVTCRSNGIVASGSVGSHKLPQPVYPKGLSLLADEGYGEVQTPLRVSQDTPKVGERVLFRPAKAGETCERFSQIHLVSESHIESVPTYRGEAQCFG